MSALPLSSASSHILHCLLALDEASRIRLFVRNRDRQQEIDRHLECAGELLMQRDWTFSLPGFEVRQVTLCNADPRHEFDLRHLAPVAQDTDRIFASQQTINDGLGQHNLGTGSHCSARISYDSGRSDILAGSQSGESLVLTLRQDREFLAVCRLDELNLCHDGLSIINFAAMSDSGDDDRIILNIENDAPVSDAQSRAETAFEPLHVALSSLSEYCKFGFDPPADVGGNPKPLSRGRAGERDLHSAYIAYRDIIVNDNIAKCNWSGRP